MIEKCHLFRLSNRLPLYLPGIPLRNRPKLRSVAVAGFRWISGVRHFSVVVDFEVPFPVTAAAELLRINSARMRFLAGENYPVLPQIRTGLKYFVTYIAEVILFV